MMTGDKIVILIFLSTCAFFFIPLLIAYYSGEEEESGKKQGKVEKRYAVYGLGKLPSGKIEEFTIYEDSGCEWTMEIFDREFMSGYLDRFITGREIYTKNKKTGLLTYKTVKYVGVKFSRCVEIV